MNLFIVITSLVYILVKAKTGYAAEPCTGNHRRLNNRGLKWVNNYRKKNAVPLLQKGTRSQLRNAVEHSKSQQRKSMLWHQDITNLKICGFLVSAENVGMSHISQNKKNTKTDAARICVDAFYKSKGHKKNILNEDYTHFTMGSCIDSIGYIWCTQTFWTLPSSWTYKSGGCRKA